MSLILSGTNGVSDVDGTAATPALRGTDTNTGIFFPAADTIAFAEGGVEAARFDSAGNLGIGTSSPTNYGAGYRTVSANGTSSGVFELQANGTAQAILVADNTDLQIQALGARPIRFFTNGNLRATLDSAGNLGLGVTPSAWFATSRVLQLGSGGAVEARSNYSPYISTTSNAFLSAGGTYTYIATAAAARYLQDAGTHAWFTAPSGTAGNSISFTQAMTLDASGNLLVGTTSSAGSFRFQVVNTNSSGNAVWLQNASGSDRGILAMRHDMATGGTTGNMVSFQNASGSVVGAITSSNTATTYNTSSDYRLKENIQPMTGALAKVALLKPCTYKWKVDGSDGEGFIAHELAEVVPQCVTGEKDAVDKDGNPQYQGIDTSFLVATLTAAIQELNAKLEAQAAEIAALKGTA